MAEPSLLPPRVVVDLSAPVSELWAKRAAQHTRDSYAGVRLSKFPEDLRVYEHLVWLSAPEVVIELGGQFGASALWFRDRLRALETYGRMESGTVISIDVAPSHGALEALPAGALDGITFLEADVRDPDLPGQVGELVGGRSCMVVEDSAHTYETTSAALHGFARFVGPGDFFVVEDGCVDVEEMRIEETWPRGVLPALEEWLRTPEGRDFRQRRDLELYGLTCHPYGFLQRR